jgi:hypothetical protein
MAARSWCPLASGARDGDGGECDLRSRPCLLEFLVIETSAATKPLFSSGCCKLLPGDDCDSGSHRLEVTEVLLSATPCSPLFFRTHLDNTLNVIRFSPNWRVARSWMPYEESDRSSSSTWPAKISLNCSASIFSFSCMAVLTSATVSDVPWICYPD